MAQLPSNSLLRRLRSLEERHTQQQQRWLEWRLPGVHAARHEGMGDGVKDAPATGGAEDLGPQQERAWSRELAGQLGLVNQQREEQTAHLHAGVFELSAAIRDAGEQQRSSLPWHEGWPFGWLSGARAMTQRVERAGTRVGVGGAREAGED